jgi:ATP-dependent RNA helicase DDX46/PRP5
MAAPGTSSVPAPTAGNAEKLEIAKRLALRINAQKNLGIESQVLSTLFRISVITLI